MDGQKLENLYKRTWRAMIDKNEKVLYACHTNSFVLVHMTGTLQSKPVYIRSILNGTLNYYSEQTEYIDIRMTGENSADVTGYSKVSATVYGGGYHDWRLRMAFKAIKKKDDWFFSQCVVSTY